MRALANLLADADQRIPELSGEVAWLRAYFAARLSDADQRNSALSAELESLSGYKRVVEPELQFLREYKRQVDKLLNPFRKVPGFERLLKAVTSVLRR